MCYTDNWFLIVDRILRGVDTDAFGNDFQALKEYNSENPLSWWMTKIRENEGDLALLRRKRHPRPSISWRDMGAA